MQDNMLYEYPWVVLKLKEELYGVATPYVQAMVAMPEIVDVPRKPAWSRGVANLRGQVIPLVDLRLRLGMDSFLDRIEALVALMHQREEDHRNWILELENSVKENRDFTLATDPHLCKFGQWYDSYQPRSFTEAQFLKKFEMPHQCVHAIAQQVEVLRQQNRQEEAYALIRKTHDGDLAEMLRLFEQFRAMIKDVSKNEIALVLENLHKRVAVAVDSIESVEMLEKNSAEEMPETLQQSEAPLVQFVAKRKKTGEVLYLLDAHTVIEESFGQ